MTLTRRPIGPLLSEQLHVLVTEPDRAFLLGCAIDQTTGGGRPPEARVVRSFLDHALDLEFSRIGSDEYDRLLRLGQAEIERRRREREADVGPPAAA